MKYGTMLKIKTRAFLNEHFLLLLILFIALLMRVQYLTQPFIDAFSWRQASTAMMAENFFKNNWNILFPEVNWTGPGPGYQGREFQTVSYLAAILYYIFGQYDFIGRLVPISFGLWGIFALYQLILLVWDKKHALAGAMVMAILPGSAFIDRSFLPDPAMVSLTTTCMWLFVLYLYKGKTIHLILAALIGCLGILSKLPGLIIALPMLYALIAVLRKRGHLDFQHLKPVIIAAVAVLIPVTAYYLWARHLSLSYPPYHFAGSGNWIWNDFQGMLRKYYLLGNLKNVMEYWLLGYPAIILFIMGILMPPPKRQDNSLRWFFHFLLLGCAFYYFIGATELIKNAWNFHVFLPVISVFCGRLLVVFYSAGNTSKWARGFRVAILLLFMIAYNVKIMREQLFNGTWAINSYKMGKELNNLKRPGDLVVTIAQDMGDPVAIYYSGAKGWVFPPADEWAPKELAPHDSTSVNSLKDLHQKGAVWFGIVNKHYEDIQTNHPELHSYLKSQMNLVKTTDDYVIFKWQ